MSAKFVECLLNAFFPGNLSSAVQDFSASAVKQVLDRFADASGAVDEQGMMSRHNSAVNKDKIKRKIAERHFSMARRQFKYNHIIHYAGPVLHHLAEIGAEIVGAAEDGIISGGEQTPFQIIDFLQEHFRLKIGRKNADKIFLLETQVPGSHIRKIVVLFRQFQHKFPFFRDHVCLIFQNPADGPYGKS